ncbi:MAG: DUF1572 domain-containing protein [Bryobacteraceae bacterium]|nr:DUF1572 domain-containing protein [Bryobacteraceae bacterium]
MSVGEVYLREVRKRMAKERVQAEKALAQVRDSELAWQPDAEANSLAVLLQHVGGNLTSRWTDFLTSDGEKPDRDRDGEFEASARSRAELMAIWERGFACLDQSLAELTEADLLRTVYIRAEPHSVIEAIERTVTHTAQHIGQMIYLAKCIRGGEWQTITMPRRMRS